MAALSSLLKAQAAPSNPQTPPTRLNPEHEWYVALQCIRRTVEDAQDKASERGPDIEGLLDAMRTACSQLLAGVDAKAVALNIASMAVQNANPQIAAQLKVAAQQMSAPAMAPAGGGAPLGLGPMGASPMGSPLGAGPMGGATAGPPPAMPGAGPVTPPVVGG
jgi:hypothetical protein